MRTPWAAIWGGLYRPVPTVSGRLGKPRMPPPIQGYHLN